VAFQVCGPNACEVACFPDVAACSRTSTPSASKHIFEIRNARRRLLWDLGNVKFGALHESNSDR